LSDRVVVNLSFTAAVRARAVSYCDLVTAVNSGNISMREFDKCVLVAFDGPLAIESFYDRVLWKVVQDDGAVIIPTSVSKVGDMHALLSVPAMDMRHRYSLHYRVIDKTGIERTGVCEFMGI